MSEKKNKETKEQCDCCDECTCDDNCTCTPEDKCTDNCTCGNHEHKHDGECDCEECHPQTAEEALKMYKQAFNKYEEVLTKLDADLEKEKKRADENEHIARCFRQDLERYKERNKNIEADAQIAANISAATKILPILDNFDKAMALVDNEQTKKGFSMIYTGLVDVITGLGLEEIKAENEVFNPELHNCVNKVMADKKHKVGLVSKVYQKGYKMAGENGKVVRHAVVEIYE